MVNTEILDFKEDYLLISKVNGMTFLVNKTKFQDKDYLLCTLDEINFYKPMEIPKEFSRDSVKTVFISLHISSKCNLNCTYCFRKQRYDTGLTFKESKEFIDLIINEYPDAGKYIVDPTGSAEPLLNKEVLLKIGKYCMQKSNEIKKEVLPMIATNGTLLDKRTVLELRQHGILFGVSLDGVKSSNDYFRKFPNGKGVYKTVVSRVKDIKDRSLMGVATTLNSKNLNVTKTLKHLIKLFPTVSIKPVRSTDEEIGITSVNISNVMNEYSKLLDFLVTNTMQGNLSFIAALLNGDDYFGKFLLRAILSYRITTRCDAGFGRFSLDANGDIYACPGAVGIKDLVVGTLVTGIDDDKRVQLYNKLIKRNKCGECFARFVCGGECMVNAFYLEKSISGLDSVLCKLRKHLYKLALLYNYALLKSPYHKTVYLACLEKIKRFDEDLEITKYLEENPQVTFMDIKQNRERYIKS